MCRMSQSSLVGTWVSSEMTTPGTRLAEIEGKLDEPERSRVHAIRRIGGL